MTQPVAKMSSTPERTYRTAVVRRFARMTPLGLAFLFSLPGAAVLSEMAGKRLGLSLPFAMGVILAIVCAFACAVCVRSHFVLARATGWAICFVGYAALANVLTADRDVTTQLEWVLYAGISGAVIGLLGSPTWKLSPFPKRQPRLFPARGNASDELAGSWPQFSLRTLLVTVAAIAVIIEFFGRETARYLQHERAVAAIWNTGGSVTASTDQSCQPLLLGWVADLLGRGSRGAILGLRFGSGGGDAELLAFRPGILTHLVRLDLSLSQASDGALVVLGQCKDLESLQLGPKTTDAGLVHLQGLQKLRSLGLDNCDIVGSGLTHLKGLPELDSLSMHGRSLTDAGLAELQGLPKLRFLTLAHTRITDTGLGNIRDLPQLQTLDLSNTQVTGVGIESLKALPKLSVLTLSDTAVADVALSRLRGFPKLDFLGVARTKVTLKGLAQLNNVLPIRVLSVEGNPVTDADLIYLHGFHNLMCLTLSGTNVTDAGLVILKELPKLEFLFLKGTQITDSGVAHLKELPRFADSRGQLDLRGTKVSGSLTGNS